MNNNNNYLLACLRFDPIRGKRIRYVHNVQWQKREPHIDNRRSPLIFSVEPKTTFMIARARNILSREYRYIFIYICAYASGPYITRGHSHSKRSGISCALGLIPTSLTERAKSGKHDIFWWEQKEKQIRTLPYAHDDDRIFVYIYIYIVRSAQCSVNEPIALSPSNSFGRRK